MGFSFGSFDFICERVPLPVCTALGSSDAKCYARNIPLGKLLLFEPGKTCMFKLFLAVLVVDIFAIVMTIIMISTIKSRYTSVGRKEMVQFFYSYFVCVLTDFLLVSNIIPFSSSIYKVCQFICGNLIFLVLCIHQFRCHTEYIWAVVAE